MSSTAAGVHESLYRYGSRQTGIWRSAALAFGMHVLLIVVLVFSVRIPSREPDVVTVELWEPPPEPQPQPVVEAPKPPPPQPKAEPVPEIKKPDIAIQEKPKPKPKVEDKPPPKVEKKPPPPKRDLQFEKQMKEQLALEQKQLQADQQAMEKAQREREAKDLAAKAQAAAASKALATWTDKIRQRIRGNIIFDLSRVAGNPEAIFDVTLLPTGEVLNVNKRKSSGNPGYDEAVERAIWKSSPLPKPDSVATFRRQLELHFRPQDQ